MFVELLASNHLLSGCGNVFPEELRVSVEQHLGPASERTRKLLRSAAVIGLEFQLPILLSASDLIAEELLDSLSEAEQLSLIREIPGSPGSYCFSHPLVRETLYRQIAGAKRAKLHGRVAELLEELYSDDSSSLASIAGHFFEAAGVGHMTKAIAYCQRAAEHATSLRDFDQSARAADLQRPIDRCELLLELARVQQGNVRASWKSLKWAATIARRISDPELMARTAFNLVGPNRVSALSGQEAESAREPTISLSHRQRCVSAVEPAAISQMPSPPHPALELWASAPDGAAGDQLTRVLGNGSRSHVHYRTEFNGLLASQGSPDVDSHQHSSVWVADEEYVFRKEGDYWTIVFEQKVLRLRHLKGLSYIAHLLRHPGREFHALQLREIVTGRVALEEPAAAHSKGSRLRQSSSVDSAAAPLLDAPARATYKQRLRELREELDESKSFNDIGRTSRIETEIQFISNEILRAEGLGGRSRTWPSESKRARVSVANAIRTALNKVRREHPGAGRFFATTIRTGYFCSFLPDPRFPKSWNF